MPPKTESKLYGFPFLRYYVCTRPLGNKEVCPCGHDIVMYDTTKELMIAALHVFKDAHNGEPWSKYYGKLQKSDYEIVKHFDKFAFCKECLLNEEPFLIIPFQFVASEREKYEKLEEVRKVDSGVRDDHFTVAETIEEKIQMDHKLMQRRKWIKLMNKYKHLTVMEFIHKCAELDDEELAKERYLRRLRCSGWVEKINKAIIDSVPHNIQTEQQKAQFLYLNYRRMVEQRRAPRYHIINFRNIRPMKIYKQVTHHKAIKARPSMNRYFEYDEENDRYLPDYDSDDYSDDEREEEGLGFENITLKFNDKKEADDFQIFLDNAHEVFMNSRKCINDITKALPDIRKHRYENFYDLLARFPENEADFYQDAGDDWIYEEVRKPGLSERAPTTFLKSQMGKLMELLSHEKRKRYIRNNMYKFKKGEAHVFDDKKKVEASESQRIFSKYETQFRKKIGDLKTLDGTFIVLKMCPKYVYAIYTNIKLIYATLYGRTMYWNRKYEKYVFKAGPVRQLEDFEMPFSHMEITADTKKKYPVLKMFETVALEDVWLCYKAVTSIMS